LGERRFLILAHIMRQIEKPGGGYNMDKNNVSNPTSDTTC
jgi:hypothetical protein